MSYRRAILCCLALSAAALSAGCNDAGTPVTVNEESGASASAASNSTAEAPAKTDDAAKNTATIAANEAAATNGTAPATSAAAAAAAPAVSSKPGTPQNITFDTLKFPLEKNEDFERGKLTASIAELNGRIVKLRGYILPSFQQSGLTQFVLVRDNMECCFGPGAALYDCVVVDMKPGKTTDYTVRPVAVEGTFELRDFKGPDGKFLAIYHLDGEAVRF